MEILNDNNVQVDVNACGPITMVSSVYKTKVLTPCIIDSTNVLKQSDLASVNTKYVIRYNFDLMGEEITVPKGCIIEFDGGSITNGTLICNNTIISCQGDIKNYIDDVTLEGDYTISIGYSYYSHTGKTANRPNLGNYDKGAQYFDEDLGKPIFWTGSKWVDATGADV